MCEELDVFGDTSLLELLLALLPGFLTAEIIAVLVLREDRTTLDRIIQALIYTFVINVIWHQLPWSNNSDPSRDLIGMGLLAVALGLLLTWLINTDVLHRILRRWRITQASSKPNEWYAAFYQSRLYTILHLHDGRRIYGWPRSYPCRSEKGHVLLENAIWLDRSGEPLEERFVDYLINVKDIRFVEFLPKPIEKDSK